jgi:DNA-binding CsgD family transcriptional regulator
MSLHPANDAALQKPRDSKPLETTTATDDGGGRSPWGRLIPGTLFAAIAVLIGVDVVGDRASGASGLHLGAETAVFLLALAGLAWLWGQVVLSWHRERQLQHRLADARADVGRLQADAARWRGEAQALLQGLGAAIDRQFAQWGLSAAEREVGLLLLKGLALKDIAEARGTSERTVRQQALTLYRKAGVAGRAELSAFFLEDLLLPRASSEESRVEASPSEGPT